MTTTTAEVPAPPAPVEAAPRPAPLAVPADSSRDRWRGRWMPAAQAAVVVGVGALAGIGFTGSYSAVRHLALRQGFGWFASVFPIGVDAGIGVLYALDLVLTRRRINIPLVRLVAGALTLATIAFNAAAAPGGAARNPLGAGMHAVLPLLFIVAVETARRAIGRAAQAEAGEIAVSGPPASRWMLAPRTTWKIWRRQRMWDVRLYADAVELYRRNVVYRRLLAQRHGRFAWRWRATADELMPLTLAPLGVGVDEALEEPERQRAADARRARQERERRELEELEAEERRSAMRIRRAEARRREAEADAEVAAAEARSAARVRTIAAEAEGEVIRAEADAQRAVRAAAAQARVDDAQAEADAARTLAQGQADALRLATESGDTAAQAEHARALRALQAQAVEARTRADLRREEQERAAEEERRAAESTSRLAAEEARAAEAKRRAAAEERRAAAEEAATEAARAATEEARRTAAEEERRAAEAARLTAEEEARAAAAADLARLTPAERQARDLAARPGGIDMPVPDIRALYGLGETAARERRARARDLIASGEITPAPAEPAEVTA